MDYSWWEYKPEASYWNRRLQNNNIVRCVLDTKNVFPLHILRTLYYSMTAPPKLWAFGLAYQCNRIVELQKRAIRTITISKCNAHTSPLLKHMGILSALQWRHNGRDSVSNHQPHDCLLNRLFRRWSKKTSKLRVTGRCAGGGEFPAQILRGKCFHLMTSSWSMTCCIRKL